MASRTDVPPDPLSPRTPPPHYAVAEPVATRPPEEISAGGRGLLAFSSVARDLGYPAIGWPVSA